MQAADANYTAPKNSRLPRQKRKARTQSSLDGLPDARQRRAQHRVERAEERVGRVVETQRLFVVDVVGGGDRVWQEEEP